MRHHIVPQRAPLPVRGVAAPPAGLIRIPALLRAARRPRAVAHQIVRRRVGFAVAAIAIRADRRLGAGRLRADAVILRRLSDGIRAAFADYRHRVLGIIFLCIRGRGSANVVVRVSAAVVAIAIRAVGRSRAGRRAGLRVGLRIPCDRMRTAAVRRRWRVFGIGGFLIRGRSLAHVVVQIHLSLHRATAAAIFGPLAGRSHPGVVVRVFVAEELFANPAVGRFAAGRSGGYLVGLRIPCDRMRTAAVRRRWRVFDIGGFCIRGRGRALVDVRVLVMDIAYRTIPKRRAGRAAAGVLLGLLVVAVILAYTGMGFVARVRRPSAPVVLIRVQAAVFLQANLANRRPGAVRRVFFFVLYGDEIACLFLTGGADFYLLVKLIIFFFIRVRKGACVLVRVLVFYVAVLAPYLCDAVRVAGMRRRLRFVAARILAHANMQTRIDRTWMPRAPAVVVRVNVAVGLLAYPTDRPAHAGRLDFTAVVAIVGQIADGARRRRFAGRAAADVIATLCLAADAAADMLLAVLAGLPWAEGVLFFAFDEIVAGATPSLYSMAFRTEGHIANPETCVVGVVWLTVLTFAWFTAYRTVSSTYAVGSTHRVIIINRLSSKTRRTLPSNRMVFSLRYGGTLLLHW